MEVQGISKQAISLNDIVKAQTGSGRISLPVRPGNLCVKFKHITGVVSPNTMPAFSLSQLRRLDNLIDKLKTLKGDQINSIDLKQLEPATIGSKIEDYSVKLHKELCENKPYKTAINSRGISLDVLV